MSVFVQALNCIFSPQKQKHRNTHTQTNRQAHTHLRVHAYLLVDGMSDAVNGFGCGLCTNSNGGSLTLCQVLLLLLVGLYCGNKETHVQGYGWLKGSETNKRNNQAHTHTHTRTHTHTHTHKRKKETKNGRTSDARMTALRLPSATLMADAFVPSDSRIAARFFLSAETYHTPHA